jgi:sugar/nucleoside kinase (ribokinase family)
MFKFGKLDFIGVGDIVTDNFIELDNAWVETDSPTKEKELCMKFGDKLPFKDIVVVPSVGNSANASVCANRLGLKSGLITNTGDDSFGKEQINVLKKEGINTKYVIIHKDSKSNVHFVLRYGAERTILVKHTEFPYSFPNISPAPKFLYLSSLASNSLEYHHQISEYLKNNPTVKLAFQPGTFQMKLGYESLKDLYEKTYLFFCNKEEAQKILKTTETDIKILIQKIKNLGPKIPIITDGPNGAYALFENKIYLIPTYPDPKPPVDRTGAGDSFASTITVALALGLPIEKALLWGPINSMSVVQYIGSQAGLLSRNQIEEYLKNAPESYKIEFVSE